MGIKIKNLRIVPYSQKDEIKVIFGDELHLSFEIPHVDGEKYLCAIDNERILYPINRPVCAYTSVFTRNEGEVSFTLNLTTSKLRDYVSSIKKPMPVYIQIVREVNGKYETILLDDILAIPSVIDGSMTVYEGDSFKELLDAKMDIPEAEGTAGQVLTLDEDGNWTWQELPEQEQADWDESDSESPSYIKNKPSIPTVNNGKITVNQGSVKKGEFTVNQSGDTVIDLNDGAQSDWDCSDSESAAYILNKPQLATVATSGSYNDLTDKPIIPEQAQADWDESDSSATDFIKNKPVIPDAQVQSDWDESDSSKVDFIKNKPALATVATSGSYNDLSNKPVIVAPVNADWDESSSEELSYILNKPALATVATSGSYNDLTNKPSIPEAEDLTDYLCFETATGASTGGFGIIVVGSVNASLEYSYDKETWTALTFNTVISGTNILGTKIYIRGDNNTLSTDLSNYLNFFANDVQVRASGNMMSLLSKDCSKFVVPSFAFNQFFKSCAGLLSAPELPATVVGEASYQGLFNSCTSLTKAPELPAMTLGENAYNSLFVGCTALTKAPDLPAQTLSPYCYTNMFGWCTSLSEAMVVLPAQTLSPYCYRQMFKQCKALKKSPLLPATTMVTHCYEEMFINAGLTEVPALPAQDLAEYCYKGMFMNNASLEEIPFNYLTATALYENCYQSMFNGCTSLKTAPELPATTLASNCYTEMFKGCTKLKYIRVNFTSWGNGNGSWLDNVYSKGVFSCPSSLPDTRGSSYIPTNWIKTAGSNEPSDDTLKKTWTSTASVFTVCPQGDKEFRVIVSSALTLNAMYVWEYAYAEIVLDIASGATVTAGTGITFVDEPTAGKLNVCIVRWADQKAKLYVVLTEDRDESSSSN